MIVADKLAEEVFKAARVSDWRRFGHMPSAALEALTLVHPLRGQGYDFAAPLLAGEHVTEDTGTGFVHTAPGHGTEDYEIWDKSRDLEARGVDTKIPFTVDEAGFFTKEAPGFEGKRVIDDKGKFGDANFAVIAALTDAGALIARARHKHDYPHSWRSKKPVIFRATPQWSIAMDKEFGRGGHVAHPRAQVDRRHALGSAARREPHHWHGRDAARLGGLAPARLGRADHCVRA